MNKAWIGYLGSLMILLAGVLMLLAGKYLVGILFFIAAIGGACIKYILQRKK